MKLILEVIKEKLQQVKSSVYYGMVDDEVKNNVWDYIVFNRAPMKINQNKTGASDYYDVNIVCENFIPEGIDVEIINKMLEIPGMRIADEDCPYNYVQKPNTNIVVEMLTIRFVKARKWAV